MSTVQVRIQYWWLVQGRDRLAEAIHHSDRRVQYTAHEYIDVARAYQFRIGMSRKGNPYDNTTAEMFIKARKAEEVYLWEYQTMGDAKGRAFFLRVSWGVGLIKAQGRNRLESVDIP